MANHKSAKTRIKRNQAAADANASYLSKMRTFVKKVERAILGGDKKAAQENFKAVESALAKASSRGVVRKATASRKTSRLSASIKKMP